MLDCATRSRGSLWRGPYKLQCSWSCSTSRSALGISLVGIAGEQRYFLTYQYSLHSERVGETYLLSPWGSTVSEPICRSGSLAAALSIPAARLSLCLSDFCFELYVMLVDE